MFEAGVHRGRKNEICGSELLNAAQTLEFRRIHQLHFESGSISNVAVHGVANQLSAHTLYFESQGCFDPDDVI